ncbi:hypothetical protein C3L33_15014, partial [Rhododendron williamsianum]
MFSLLQASFDNLERSMLVLPTTMLTEPNKRDGTWHSLPSTVEGFLHPLKKPRKKSPVSSTRVVIDVFEPHPCFPKIDQSVLAGIVKQKNLDQLGKYDGVEGLACGLETNLRVGLAGTRGYESSMTGESDHVEVDLAQNPFLFSGTKVADGFGRMLVTSVGMNTTWGEMMSTISNDSNEQTPLQSRLNTLTSSIGKVGSERKMEDLLDFEWNGIGLERQGYALGDPSFCVSGSPPRAIFKLSRAFSKIQVDVVRSGRWQLQVSIFNIVVGDVVYVKIGDQVLADGLFIDGHSLLVEESSITGESDHVEVDLTQNPFLLSGTKYFIGNTKDENGNTEYNGKKTKASNIINSVIAVITAAVIIVDVAIPESFGYSSSDFNEADNAGFWGVFLWLVLYSSVEEE